MPQEKTILAIFDFDGTLTEGHLWKGLYRYYQANKSNRLAFYSYMAGHLPLWLAAKLKIYPDDKNRIAWGRDLPVLLRKFNEEEAQIVFEWIAGNYFMPLLRPDMLEVMREHQSQGHGILLLSGMFNEFLEVIGKKLKVDFVIGTLLEKKAGCYTGKIIPPLCFGEHKSNYLQGFIRKQALNVDYAASYAYADSVYDGPVFGLVGHPVAVYPDKELLKQAQKRGWKIIGATGKSHKT